METEQTGIPIGDSRPESPAGFVRSSLMTDVATVALWISGISLLVAASSLSWQIFNALRVDRARLTVAVESRVLVRKPSAEPEDVVFVQATNIGKRPTYLTGLWLGLGQSKWPIWKRLLPKSWRGEFHSGTPWPNRMSLAHLQRDRWWDFRIRRSLAASRTETGWLDPADGLPRQA